MYLLSTNILSVVGDSFLNYPLKSQAIPKIDIHSADSSNELPDLHTMHTRVREVHASLATEWPSAREVQASAATEWPPACLLKLLPEDIKAQMKKTSNKRCFQI